MYKGYAELTALSPTAYLDWESFVTPWDKLPATKYAEEQYQTGKGLAAKYTRCGICADGTWFAASADATLTSCEGIGYHSCTKDLLHGMLDSGLPVYVYRYNTRGATRIK